MWSTPGPKSLEVFYRDDATGCGSVKAILNIMVDSSAIPFALTSGGSYCSGGVVIGLANSETGRTYQLMLNGAPVGSPVAGTGAPISFGGQTVAGTYTVVGTNTATNCSDNMTGSIPVTSGSAPAVSNETRTICSGSSFSVSPPSVPAGTKYSWSAPTITGGITGGAAASDQTNITGTLTNPTATAQTATYSVTPSTPSCTGAPFQ